MSQYIPPHLRSKGLNAKPVEPTVISSVESRSSVGTMASLTRANKKGNTLTVTNVSSDDDFPTLGKAGSRSSVSSVVLNQRYSELARSWGIQKREEEEAQKKQASLRIAESQRLKEEAEKEKRYFNVKGLNMTAMIAQSGKQENGSMYDLGRRKEEEEWVEDELDQMVEEEEEEEEAEYDLDADWNRRRSKNDLY
jgi:hypothetical protein